MGRSEDDHTTSLGSVVQFKRASWKVFTLKATIKTTLEDSGGKGKGSSSSKLCPVQKLCFPFDFF